MQCKDATLAWAQSKLLAPAWSYAWPWRVLRAEVRGVAHHTEGLPWWDGIQHSLPCYSVSALILAGIVPHLPWSEARGRRQRLPGISCTMRQRHASSSGTLLTQAPTNLLEAPRLLGTAQASAPCQYLLRCDARRCFQQRGHQAQLQPPAAAPSSRLVCGSSPRVCVSRWRG